MTVTPDLLKSHNQYYLLARWVDGELSLEPTCACGNPLEEDFTCTECNRECTCTFIACEDPQSLAVAEKLVSGNPRFRNFRTALLEK
jgi:hypothetical protein